MWDVNDLGGYMYTVELSDILRGAIRPLDKYRYRFIQRLRSRLLFSNRVRDRLQMPISRRRAISARRWVSHLEQIRSHNKRMRQPVKAKRRSTRAAILMAYE